MTPQPLARDRKWAESLAKRRSRANTLSPAMTRQPWPLKNFAARSTSVVIDSNQLGAPRRLLSASMPSPCFGSHTSNAAPLGSKQTAIRPWSKMSNAGCAVPPSAFTRSTVASALPTFTITPMCGGVPGGVCGLARSNSPPTSRPPTCTRWPTPGISTYVQPSRRA